MKKIYCDICKEEIPIYSNVYSLDLKTRINSHNITEYHISEMCQKCADNIRYLTSGKKVTARCMHN